MGQKYVLTMDKRVHHHSSTWLIDSVTMLDYHLTTQGDAASADVQAASEYKLKDITVLRKAVILHNKYSISVRQVLF